MNVRFLGNVLAVPGEVPWEILRISQRAHLYLHHAIWRARDIVGSIQTRQVRKRRRGERPWSTAAVGIALFRYLFRGNGRIESKRMIAYYSRRGRVDGDGDK